jgi:hypothetical protein
LQRFRGDCCGVRRLTELGEALREQAATRHAMDHYEEALSLLASLPENPGQLLGMIRQGGLREAGRVLQDPDVELAGRSPPPGRRCAWLAEAAGRAGERSARARGAGEASRTLRLSACHRRARPRLP